MFGSKPTVVYLPGVSGNVALIEPLRKKFNVVFPPLWRNEAELKQKSIEELHSELDTFLHPYEHVFVVGKSLGGALFLTFPSKKIKGMVLWAPSFSYADVSNYNIMKKKPFGQINHPLDVKIDIEYVISIKCPVLIIHGAADEVIPLENSKNISKHIMNGRLITIPDANHAYTGKEAVLLAETEKFILQYLK